MPNTSNTQRVLMIDRVEGYINEFGSITTLDAFKDLGCSRLSEYIRQLRLKYANNEEVELADCMESGENRWGDKTSYKRWFFRPKDHQTRLDI